MLDTLNGKIKSPILNGFDKNFMVQEYRDISQKKKILGSNFPSPTYYNEKEKKTLNGLWYNGDGL